MVTGFSPSRRVPPVAGGLLALLIPSVLIAIALSVGFGFHDDLATAFLATLLVGLAAPTAWLFAIDFIHASALTILVLGVLSSFPLWYMLGAFLADRSSSWRSFLNRYSAFLVLYVAVIFGLITIADSLMNG